MDIQQDMFLYERMRHINVQVSEIRFLKKHMHDSFEIGYVLDGEALFQAESQTRNLSAGDIILLNPYEAYSLEAYGEKPLIILMIYIHKLFVRRYIEQVPKLKFDSSRIEKLEQEAYNYLFNTIQNLVISFFTRTVSQPFEILAYASLLLGELVSFLPWELEENPDSAAKELQRNRMQRLAGYIDENYRQKITLSMLAEMEGISTTHLSHFFKKSFGVSFQTYLSTQRLAKALVLLHDESIPIVDICMNCGFSDSRYLEAACQRTFGCSVNEYRKKLVNRKMRRLDSDEATLYWHCSDEESWEILKKYWLLE